MGAKLPQSRWEWIRNASELLLLNGGTLGPGRRMLFAAGAIGLAFLIRYLLDPLFGPDRFVFSSFYLAVVVIAFVAGVVPALVASVVVAPIAYWAFAEPSFAWGTNQGALAAIYFYTLTTAMNILFIALLKRVLAENHQRRIAAEQQAEGHAALFREFNQRSAQHLQLVAALLDALASDDRDGRYAHVVADTSSKTLAIARLHRALDSGGAAETDITAFARHMLLASVESGARQPVAIEVAGDALLLPAEQATSVAVILLEYLRALLDAGAARIALAIDAPGRTLTLSAQGAGGGALAVGLADPFARDVVKAALQQLSGALVDGERARGAALRLSLPLGDGSALPPDLTGWAAQPAGRAN